MTILKTKKIAFVLLFLGLIIAAFSFQRQKLDRSRPRETRIRQQRIRSLNGGLPFHVQGPRYVPAQVLVKFKPNLQNQLIDATVAAYSAKKVKRIPRLGVYQLRIPKNITVEEMVYALNRNPDVEYAEPNFIARIALTPNDPLFEYQYALLNTGQEIGIPGLPGGKAGADIKASAAWDRTKGSTDDIIASIDSGVDFSHPDIKNKFVSRGRDFVNNDFDATDDVGHGTFVAGIAAADTNNDEGVAGVAWNCRILPIKVIDENGEGDYSWLVEAIIWAADNGADVISISLGGEDSSDSLRDALQYAHDRGIVIAASAGNDGTSVLYPAAYDDYCLAVAATDYNDLRTSWSNFGSQVDVAAPGENVIGPVPTWYWPSLGYPGEIPYAIGSGTSASAPHIAGMAALLKSFKPWLTADQVMDIIRFTADDVNSGQNKGKDEFIGYGRINMEKALVPIKISK